MRNEFFYEMRADQSNRFYMIYYDITKEHPKDDDVPHYHQAMEFVYVTEGKFPVHIEGEKYTLHTGEVAFVRSGQGHFYTSDGDAKVFVLMASTDFLDNPLLGGQCCLPTLMTLPILKKCAMSRFLYTMLDIWSPGNSILCQGIFSTFYGMLAEEFLAAEKYSENLDFPIVSILKYINKHYMEPISLKSLAIQYNYTETYFSSCFNTLVNIPIREYINRIRIQHVNAYIESGFTKLQAAELCGYSNKNTFYRAYNKYHNEPLKDMPISFLDNTKQYN